MDPIIDRVLRNLSQAVESLDDQLLNGKVPTIESYRAMVSLRNAYSSMMADIKEALDDEHTRSTDEIDE